MQITDCFQWVDANRLAIIRFSNRYRGYAPYDAEDFMQNAHLAAVEALGVVCKTEGRVRFPQAFWVRFRAVLAMQVPHPESKGSCSHSIPVSDCSCLEEDRYPGEWDPWGGADGVSREMRCNAVIEHMLPKLDTRELLILEGALGIGPFGYLSNYEMATRLGCVVSHVRSIRKRVVAKLYEAYGCHGISPDDHDGLCRRYAAFERSRLKRERVVFKRKSRQTPERTRWEPQT